MILKYCVCSKRDLIYMSTPELIQFWGYNTESHLVKTEDSYLLTMHRIPNPNSTYYPIIVQHGILLASDSWVLRGPEEDLVFLLADRGFDIWLANTRGNYYSKSHISYNSMQKRFWDFGWDELGMYDIPAMIKYVQKITDRDKIVHMGHSMGTTSFYAMLSKKPEMNDKILAHISLAPVAYMDRMRSLEVLRPITLIIKQLIQFQEHLKLYDLFARDKRISLLISKICNVSKRNKRLCFKIMFYFVGPDYDQLKAEYFDRLIGHFPSGASATMFLHFIQNVLSKEFRELDFGPAINIQKYGKLYPPLYNLTRVTAPVYLYYSLNDFLSHNLDVERLAKKLPNVKKKYLVPYRWFNHIDFILALDSKNLLYNDIIRTLKNFLLPL